MITKPIACNEDARRRRKRDTVSARLKSCAVASWPGCTRRQKKTFRVYLAVFGGILAMPNAPDARGWIGRTRAARVRHVVTRRPRVITLQDSRYPKRVS